LSAHGKNGAYGLRLRGISADDMLVPAAPDWPTLRVEVAVADSPLETESVTDERADLRLRTGGRLEVDRARGLATYIVPRALTDQEVIHPFLAPAAAVMAHWLGRPCFHAGAFVAGGKAWGLLGDREAGKSTTLARLALSGNTVIADDIVVLSGTGDVYAGPRSIDLREETAARLTAGDELGTIGARERWRMKLAPCEMETPFGGWFFLGWGSRLETVALSGSECLVRLMGQRTLRVRPLDPAEVLPLAALPAWEILRAPDWSSLEETTNALLSLATADGTGA
jgi:hypothetical protein